MNFTSREKVVDLAMGRRLRDLGFNYPTMTYQVNADNGAIVTADLFNHNLHPDHVSLPSYALVVQWLSDEKGVDVSILPTFTEEGREFKFITYTSDEPDGLEHYDRFADRDDAMLAGIAVGLNLING